MTIFDTDIDTDLIMSLDFEYAPQCEWNMYSAIYDQCPDEADWKLVLSCCGGMFLMCDPHKEKQLTLISLYMARKANLTHDENRGGCGADGVKIILVEKI